jgi:hypothetical protein
MAVQWPYTGQASSPPLWYRVLLGKSFPNDSQNEIQNDNKIISPEVAPRYFRALLGNLIFDLISEVILEVISEVSFVPPWHSSGGSLGIIFGAHFGAPVVSVDLERS